MSQITDRADEIRAAAKGCKTLAHLWKKFPDWSLDMIRAADKQLNLGLAPVRTVSVGKPRTEFTALPKPVSKKGK